MSSVEQLYGEVDNLQGLVHPLWQRSFQYMSEFDVVALAERIIESVIKSGRRTVVVSETGAAPLGEICAQLAARQRYPLTFLYFKFPRASVSNIFPLLAHFLSASELQQVEDRLQQICNAMPTNFFKTEPADVLALLEALATKTSASSFQRAIAELLTGTQIARQLSEPFIYLDDYIDSGLSFRNAISYLNCFVMSPDIVTASYYVRSPEARHHDRVLFVDCTADDRPDCFSNGAYPYENRIDLIGHFYIMDEKQYAKREVAMIPKRLPRRKMSTIDDFLSPSKFIDRLGQFLHANGLLEMIRRQFSEPQLAQFIKLEHLVRHCLYLMERDRGERDCAEFLFQMADMYGPAWTPMPVALHLDFWQGFAALEPALANIPEYRTLAPKYDLARALLLAEIAAICGRRRLAWLRKIDKHLEEKYGEKPVSADDRVTT